MSAEAVDVERLRARVANLERMVDRLAHELTTPLTTAHGFARILLDGDQLPPEVRVSMERIERSTGTALAMLRSRLDEAVGDEPRSIRLRTLVRDVVSEVLGDSATAGSDLPEDARVFADLAGLRAALSLVLGAFAEHAASHSVAPTGLVVELGQERGTGYQLRLDVAAPPLPSELRRGGHAVAGDGPEDSIGVRLRRAEALLAPIGARLWLDHPGAGHQLSALLELPRDVEA